MVKNLDEIDSKIITSLQADGRMSVTKIAKKINITETSVRKRMNKLIDQKIIQIVAIGNFYNLGIGVSGFFIIHSELKDTKTIIEKLKKISQVWLISRIIGSEGNISASFACSEFERYNQVLEKISQIKEIKKIEQNFHTEIFKEDYRWQFAGTE